MSQMWDQRYQDDGFAYGQLPNDFLAESLPVLPRGRALCLAEGEGRNAVFLAKNGFEVTAVDQSAVGLEKARKLAESMGVSIATEQADLSDFEIGQECWDLVVSIWAHVPSSIRVPLHRSVVKGLKPGGAFLLEAYTPRQLELKTGGPPQLDLLMTLDALKGELAGLKLEVGREIDREVREGKYHTGLSAVVQVLARRES